MLKTSSSSFCLPALLEQVFERYSKDEYKEKLGDLFVELSTLLGARVVESALHLLDNQTIVVYHNCLRTREVAEISEGYTAKSKRLIRLFPRINYCTCDSFQYQVLNTLKSPDSPYTCKHVLALRLAFLTKSKQLRFEEVPSHKLNSLLPHFLAEDEEQ